MLKGTAREAAAEFFGTFILIAFGVGVVAQTVLSKGANGSFLAINIGWGLAVMLGIYASAGVSGAHLNPAVTVGLWAGGRFAAADVLPYVVAQVIGGTVGAGILYLIASGAPGFDIAGGLASNGYGEHSPGGYSLVSGLVAELVLTFMFLVNMLGAMLLLPALGAWLLPKKSSAGATTSG